MRNDCKVDKLNFCVAINHWDRAKMRLNFYSVENGEPKELIVDKDIIFEIRNKQTGWVMIDLNPYGIYLDGKQQVAVTMTLLDNDTDGKPKVFMLNAALSPFSQTIGRLRAMDKWIKVGYGRPVFSIDIISYDDK